MGYLLRFEEYLDDCGLYVYGEEWLKAQIVSEPKISSYWFVIDLLVPEDFDLKGARRVLRGTKNKILVKELDDGQEVIRFKILRRELDAIEDRNQRRAEREAAEED